MPGWSSRQCRPTRRPTPTTEPGPRAARPSARSSALAEGIPTVCAEAAFLWVCAGQPDRARSLVHMFHGTVLDEQPRDVNWLLTMQCVLEAALAVDDRDADARRRLGLLAPYEGRAVINGGGVMFHGVTDDPLARAAGRAGGCADRGAARRASARDVRTHRRALVARPARALSRGGGRAADWGPAPDAPAPDRRRAVAGRAGRRGGHDPRAAWLRLPARTAAPAAGQPVAALDLVGAGTGVVAESGLGEVADRQALAAYRQRLRDLDEEIDEAQEWSDQRPHGRGAGRAGRAARGDRPRHRAGRAGRGRSGRATSGPGSPYRRRSARRSTGSRASMLSWAATCGLESAPD